VPSDTSTVVWCSRLRVVQVAHPAGTGVSPADVTILLHPIALAGWFGLFVTFLNLLPGPAADGGHVGLRAHSDAGTGWVARCSLLVIIACHSRMGKCWLMWRFS